MTGGAGGNDRRDVTPMTDCTLCQSCLISVPRLSPSGNIFLRHPLAIAPNRRWRSLRWTNPSSAQISRLKQATFHRGPIRALESGPVFSGLPPAFKNERKSSDTHADYTGSIKISGREYWLNAWLKDGAKGKWMSLSLKPKQAQTGRDADVPF